MTTEQQASGQPPVRLLNRSQVRSLLRWPELIDSVEHALLIMANGHGVTEDALHLRVPGASMHLKAGALIAEALVTVKSNIRPDAGSSAGVIIAFDSSAGRIRAILDSADLTAMRTAAMAAVAARQLVRSRGLSASRDHCVAVIGAGPVGSYALAALAQVVPVAEMRVWSRDPGRAEQVAASAGTPVVTAPSPAAAADGAGIVLTATPSRQPLLQAADLNPDAIVLAMGADSAGKRELGDGVLDDAVLVTDVAAHALAVGERAYLAAESGSLPPVELGALLAGQEQLSADGLRIIFDSVGSAVVDAAVTGLVLRLAERENAGHSYWISH